MSEIAEVRMHINAIRRSVRRLSPRWRRCTNILEMLDAGTARPSDIAEQVRELAALSHSKGD